MAIVAARKKRRVKKRHVRAKKRHPKKLKPHKPAPKSAAKPTTIKKPPSAKPRPAPSSPSAPTSTGAASPGTPSSTSSTPQSPAPSATFDPAAPQVATSRERLFLNRFGTGFTQRALSQVRQAGSPDAWLSKQLNPDSVTESTKMSDIDGWFADLRRTPAQKFATDAAKTKRNYEYARDLGNWSIVRRIYSERSVLETMVDFWSTILHVPSEFDYAWIYRFDYDATIRQNAFGTFEQMLLACSLHPAMRTYLSNWKSVKNNPNENQGRELLELHTVGLDADYTEAMVKSSAAILSGYTVDWGGTFAPIYNPGAHTTGPVQVLDFSSPNSSSDGQAVAAAYLKYLAHHPSTARSIARKAATYFVCDTPSDGLINSLAEVYLSSGTDMTAVLTALSKHPEFLTSEGLKVRTPEADLVAMSRAMDIDVTTPTSEHSFATWASYVHGGALLFTWPRPDGVPMTGSAYSSISRVFSSLQMHMNLGSGAFPSEGVTYRPGASWLPSTTIRFDAFVDHLSRMWLGRSASNLLQSSASQGVGLTAGTTLNASALSGTWKYPRLVMAVFDSPEHMTT